MAIPAFVINLDRRKDRWEAISHRLDDLGIKTTRVAALDGALASSDDFYPFVSMDGWARRRDLDQASAACIVSHRDALNRFLRKTDAPAALILEDDVRLASDLAVFLKAVELALGSMWLLKLDVDVSRRRPRRRSLGLPVGTIERRGLHPIGSWIPGAGAYVVTRDTASAILHHCYDVTEGFDRILFDLRISGLARQLRPILIQPALAEHQPEIFASDIHKHRKTAPRTGPVRELASSLRKAPRRTFVGLNLATGQMKRTTPRFADKV